MILTIKEDAASNERAVKDGSRIRRVQTGG